jgi:Xaa-Pro aminopeptidase
MKKELDQIMQEMNLDAILVQGSAMHNPSMTYFLGPVHMGDGDLIKKRGEQAVIFCNTMEREEAGKAGLPVIQYSKYDILKMVKESNGNRAIGFAKRYKEMFTDLGLTQGRVGIYGTVDFDKQWDVINALQKEMPNIEFIGSVGRDVLQKAMVTKNDQEAQELRKVSDQNSQVVLATLDFIKSHVTKNEVMVKSNGDPLTIGDVKDFIRLRIAEFGLENPHGEIFAIGADAGVPHNAGTASNVLKLGKTIIFDIYPCQFGGGYHSDMTRTWSLGYATDETQKLYDDVFEVHQAMEKAFKVGTPFHHYQTLTCDMFETKGYATINKDRTLQSGYIHSLGHGIGLRVHEAPWCQDIGPESDILSPGMAFTNEPGLYYAEKEMGARVEDSYFINADNSIEKLTKVPYDFVIPVKKA